MDTTFLDAASTEQKAACFADIQFSDQETLKFKLDTGADVRPISHLCYQSLSHPPPLNSPYKAIYGPSRQPLQVRGQCYCHLSFKRRSCKQKVFIIKGLNHNHLGLPAITFLNLAKRMDETIITAALSPTEITVLRTR